MEAYIEGTTWDDLETKFNVSRGALQKHIKDEDWEGRKARRQADLAKRVINNHVKSTVKDLSAFNKVCENSAEIACEIARKLIIRMSNALAKQDIEPDTKKLLDYIRISRESLDMKRLILGIPLPSQTEVKSDEFGAYERRLAELVYGSMNGDPLDLTKTTMVQIEPPPPSDKIN